MRKLLLFALVACAPPLPPPDQPGARDAYRAALAADPKGPRAAEARDRLEEAEWEAAREAHTIFAYRRFLKEFEDSRHAPEARQLLEGLRWASADKSGSEAALAAYVEDEPRGAHAHDAWARLSALRLAQALAHPDAEVLRAWLAENPAAAGREKALAALDAADWRAGDARRYLDTHPDGAHRKEARERLDRIVRDEAELLEDEPALRSLRDPAADRLVFEKAAALLDEGRLAQLARRPGPFAPDAARDLALLRKDSRKAAALEQAAHALYLPRAVLDELPETAPERAQRLREWAAALDGTRLHRILGEIASPRAQVALAALESAEALLDGLPRAEARVRAERELAALLPISVDAPQLAAVALLQHALGRDGDALSSARAAASRNPHCAPAVWLAARLESDPGLRPVALQALRAQSRDLADAHAANVKDPAAIGELCAALRGLELAADLGRGDSHSDLGRAGDEAQRVRNVLAGAQCSVAKPDFVRERLEAVRALKAAATPLARPALVRAAARDPDPTVRAEAGSAVALDSR